MAEEEDAKRVGWCDRPAGRGGVKEGTDKIPHKSHLEQQPWGIYDPRMRPGGMVGVMCCVVPGHAEPAMRLSPKKTLRGVPRLS